MLVSAAIARRPGTRPPAPGKTNPAPRLPRGGPGSLPLPGQLPTISPLYAEPKPRTALQAEYCIVLNSTFPLPPINFGLQLIASKGHFQGWEGQKSGTTKTHKWSFGEAVLHNGYKQISRQVRPRFTLQLYPFTSHEPSAAIFTFSTKH